MKRNTLKTGLLTLSALALAGATLVQAQTRAPSPEPKAPPAADRPHDSGDRTVGDKARDAGQRASQALDDTAITTAVKAKILAEPGLKVLDISVDTDKGVVKLTGAVDSALNVQKAEQIAAGTDGVKSVDNKLTVRAKG